MVELIADGFEFIRLEVVQSFQQVSWKMGSLGNDVCSYILIETSSSLPRFVGRLVIGIY